MINFTQAFDTAWERMHVILFRPFDFGKWCAIGLSAFLAGMLEGGNGFNSSPNSNSFHNLNKSQDIIQAPNMPSNLDLHHLGTNFQNLFNGLQVGLIIFIFAVVFLIIFAVVMLLYWLGARGQFMILDNIVRNRGAIAWPWRTYARQANSVFWFYLLAFGLILLIILPILLIGVVMGIPLFTQHRWATSGEIVGFVILGLIYLAICLVVGVLLFLFRAFGIPLMFRNGLTARAAFGKAIELLRQHPGSVVVFLLLRFAIAIGVAILSIIACCFTCCLELLPYVGTVILLPVLIFVRCFTLECLAQFGPEYNVWTVDVSTASGVAPTLPPSI